MIKPQTKTLKQKYELESWALGKPAQESQCLTFKTHDFLWNH